MASNTEASHALSQRGRFSSSEGGRVDSDRDALFMEFMQSMQQQIAIFMQRFTGGGQPVQLAAAVDQSTPVVSDSVSSLRQALPAAAGVQGTLVVSDFVSRSGRQTLSAAAVPTVSAAVPAVSTASVVQITPAVSESVEDFYMKIWKNKTSTSPWYNRSMLLPEGQYFPSRLHDKRHRFWPYRLSFYSRVKYIQRLCITPRKQVFSGNQKKRKKNNCSNTLLG